MTKLNRNETVSIKDASSGEQSVVLTFIGLASEIENNSLVLIDEPEISLHPEWQEKFLELLRTTFEGYKGCHFVLATHSPLLLTKFQSRNCSVVTMDDMEIRQSNVFSNKSVDFQLARAFGTPGYGNEYLAREGLAALKLASNRKYDTQEFKAKLSLLSKLRSQLRDDDPVALLTDALIQAVEEVK